MGVQPLCLTAKCAQRLENFIEHYLKNVPLEIYRTIFSCFPNSEVANYEDVVTCLRLWGRLSYNHLYISLFVSVPWSKYYWDSPYQSFKRESDTLSYDDEQNIFRYIWIGSEDNDIVHMGVGLYLDVWTCVREGYKTMDSFSSYMCNNTFFWLGVENYEFNSPSLLNIPSVYQGFEMPCSEGRVRFTDNLTGLTIERTPYIFDFVYNEYVVLQSHHYVYSECEDLRVVLQDYIQERGY